MRYELLYQPAYAVARVLLDPGETVRAEPGSMVSMSPTVTISSSVHGGIGKALGRLLGGESVFQTTFTATHGAGEVLLAPSTPGDIRAIAVSGEPLMVTSGSFLACDTTLEGATQASFRSLFGGEGLFMMRFSGVGTMLVGSFGAIHAVQLAPGQPYIVDTGHLVAFSDGMGYEVRKSAKSLFGTMTSGEGIVVELKGPGTVYIQTRTPRGFASWLDAFLPGKG